jgi:hypothetical protein
MAARSGLRNAARPVMTAPMRTDWRTGGRSRAWACALLAVFALAVQALAPAAALAAQARGGDAGLVICTANGVETLGAEGHGHAPHKGFAGLPCQDCLSLSQAVVAAPALSVTPAIHAASRVVRPPAARPAFKLARAPPRPPGQGPPADIA